ncbi:MAG: cytochrome c biogenesis CcdA family protein [Methanobacteriaceae archaeon]|jgi:cytochrome c-type biogenesis protein|nr:cytochrome c biogenesis CcdA family protein [Methanobacteriaceae archaeon]
MEFVFIISFLAGIASVLSPCVLPVIPVVVGYNLVKRRKIEILSFVIGLFSIFTATIFLTVIFTAAVNYYLYYFRIMAAVVLVLLGIMTIVHKSIFKFSISTDSNRRGITGSFVWGLITSLAWAPCYGSYLITLIALSVSTGNTFYSALNILIYTLGFLVSIFTMGLIISSINLEKIVGKADLIRRLSGILIFLAGIYMFGLVLL